MAYKAKASIEEIQSKIDAKLAKNPAHRPPAPPIDFKILDNLCLIQCTAEEIAAVLELSVETVDKQVREKYDVPFSEYLKLKSAVGKSSLRRSQWKMAQNNPAMAIFLGKNLLGQKDKSEIDYTKHLPVIVDDSGDFVDPEAGPGEE